MLKLIVSVLCLTPAAHAAVDSSGALAQIELAAGSASAAAGAMDGARLSRAEMSYPVSSAAPGPTLAAFAPAVTAAKPAPPAPVRGEQERIGVALSVGVGILVVCGLIGAAAGGGVGAAVGILGGLLLGWLIADSIYSVLS